MFYSAVTFTTAEQVICPTFQTSSNKIWVKYHFYLQSAKLLCVCVPCEHTLSCKLI